MSISIVEFGRQVARALGSGASAARLARQEEAIVAFARRKQSRRTLAAWLRWSLGTATACAALGWGIYFVGSRADLSRPAAEASDPQHNALDAFGQRWVALSDGSRLAVGDSARVEVLDRPDARVRLVTGEVNVEVVKQSDRDWVLLAGPYRIAVLGTRFHVAFDRGSEAFEVRVKEGLVRVFGRDLPAGGLNLRAGQAYVSDQLNGPTSATMDGGVSSEHSVDAADSTSKVGAGARAANSPSTGADRTLENDEAYAWREACASGRYAEAFLRQSGRGFTQVTDGASEATLLTFANCLRYAGRNSEARRALSRLRERFPGSPGAVLAAYHLARLSQREAKRDAAIRWFETYLAESPRGKLAASARAELVRLWTQQGNVRRARASARDYLRLHPNGGFAEQARELIERDAPPQ